MKSNYIIIALLASILFVLVHGKEEFVKDVEILFWIGLALQALYIVWCIIRAVVGATKDAIREEKNANRAWISFAIGYISMIVTFLVGGVAAIWYFISSEPTFMAALKEIPFWWAPMVLSFFAFVVLVPIENLIRGTGVSEPAQSESSDENC